MKKFAQNNRWLLLAFLSAMMGLQMSTPAYAGMGTTCGGKLINLNNGCWACDCRLEGQDCFCC